MLCLQANIIAICDLVPASCNHAANFNFVPNFKVISLTSSRSLVNWGLRLVSRALGPTRFGYCGVLFRSIYLVFDVNNG